MRNQVNVQSLLNAQAGLFMQGRLDEMLDVMALPLPVYMEGNLIALRSRGEVRQALAAHRAAFEARGATGFVPRVAAVELPREGRFRAWVRWSHRYGEEARNDGSDVIYYFRRLPNGGLTVEMIDYIHLDMTDTKHFEPRHVA